MVEAIQGAEVLWRGGDMPGALSILKDFHAKLVDTKAYLAETDHPMIAELGKWIKKFNMYADVFGLCIAVLEGAPKRDDLAALMEAYNENAAVFTEFCFRGFVETVLEVAA